MKSLKKVFKRVCGIILAMAIAFTLLPAGAVQTAAAETGQTVTFGSYPQTLVTDPTTISGLNNATLQPDNTVVYGSYKYLKVYFTQYTPFRTTLEPDADNSYQDENGYYTNTVYWFKFEPIQWRVLYDVNSVQFLVAEKILDAKAYNQTYTGMTWENCSLRTWLNSDFYNLAFSAAEKLRIKTSAVSNQANPWTGTQGGNNTLDKLFLLSCGEAVKPANGFCDDHNEYDTARRACGTAYAESRGLAVSGDGEYTGNGYWLLRSPGLDQVNIAAVLDRGNIQSDLEGVTGAYLGIRPAVRISSFAVGDIINYGSYPQTKVTDAGLTAALDAQTLGADNTVAYGGAKYLRVYFTAYTPNSPDLQPTVSNTYQDDNGYFVNTVYWFRFDPVRWRVLADEGDKLYLMAENILAARGYNSVSAAITWENCALRTWLNNDFYSKAFSPYEQSKILTSSLVNEDNPTWGTDGGNDTQDKLFLPSYSDAVNANYGFWPSAGTYDLARRAQGTDYAKSEGLEVSATSSYLGNSRWWLRTPGKYTTRAFLANEPGYLSEMTGTYLRQNGVRPAMRIMLPQDSITAVEDSGCIVDKSNRFIRGLAAGISSLDGYAAAAAGHELAFDPSPGGFGTGTVVRVTYAGETVDSYTIVLFGDVNGDGSIDSIDAGVMVDVENYAITWDPAADAVYIKAADLNGDGSVDSMDAGIAVDAENYIVTIDQGTGLAS